MGETPADHPMEIETTVRTRAASTFPNPTGARRPRATGVGLAQGPFFKTIWRFFSSLPINGTKMIWTSCLPILGQESSETDPLHTH